MKIVVIIPAYNEERNIGGVLREVRAAQPSAHVVVVNDGSTDDTKGVAEREGATVLELPINLGIGGAVQTGFLYADSQNYDIAIQIDGDGQHVPSYIGDLIEPIGQGKADVVIGSRFLDRGGFKSTFFRRVGIYAFSLLNSILIGQKITDNTSGFRAYNRRAIRFLSTNYPYDYPEPEAVILLGRNNFKIAEVPVRMREREHGRSSITRFRTVYYMVKVVLASCIDVFRKPVQKRGGDGA